MGFRIEALAALAENCDRRRPMRDDMIYQKGVCLEFEKKAVSDLGVAISASAMQRYRGIGVVIAESCILVRSSSERLHRRQIRQMCNCYHNVGQVRLYQVPQGSPLPVLPDFGA